MGDRFIHDLLMCMKNGCFRATQESKILSLVQKEK